MTGAAGFLPGGCKNGVIQTDRLLRQIIRTLASGDIRNFNL